jgi:hypothetical protein
MLPFHARPHTPDFPAEGSSHQSVCDDIATNVWFGVQPGGFVGFQGFIELSNL